MPALARSTIPAVQRRQKWSISNPFSRKTSGTSSDPSAQLDDSSKRAAFLQPQHGGAQNSIFEDEIQAASEASETPDGEKPQGPAPVYKTRDNTAMVLNPNPRGDLRWHRKKVMQMVRKNGQLSKEERVRMTERELLHKSAFIPTSVKKLVMLSRQIAGKPVDDAIAQMKWSKKKMGREIQYYLEQARDLAIAQRGMGLGRVNGETLPKPIKIQTLEGKWIEISDPTTMYVAQSWVGRGKWRGRSLDYKGRGRTGIMQHPATSMFSALSPHHTQMISGNIPSN